MRSSPGVSTLIRLYITVALVATLFIDGKTRIKRTQIGDYEIKQ